MLRRQPDNTLSIEERASESAVMRSRRLADVHGGGTEFAFLLGSLNHRKLQACSRQKPIDRDRKGLLLGLGSLNNPV